MSVWAPPNHFFWTFVSLSIFITELKNILFKETLLSLFFSCLEGNDIFRFGGKPRALGGLNSHDSFWKSVELRSSPPAPGDCLWPEPPCEPPTQKAGSPARWGLAGLWGPFLLQALLESVRSTLSSHSWEGCSDSLTQEAGWQVSPLFTRTECWLPVHCFKPTLWWRLQPAPPWVHCRSPVRGSERVPLPPPSLSSPSPSRFLWQASFWSGPAF